MNVLAITFVKKFRGSSAASSSSVVFYQRECGAFSQVLLHRCCGGYVSLRVILTVVDLLGCCVAQMVEIVARVHRITRCIHE